MYDAIVIGARCAGASTAMLLARRGHRVLLVDRASFPSDIPHGHFIHRLGPRRLAEWGLLERILATGCPPVTAMISHAGDYPLTGRDLIAEGAPLGVGPRRTALDRVLVEAAVEAGAELRERFPVRGYTSDGDRITGIEGPSRERASVVVGADGRNSALAAHVGAPAYEEVPALSCWYFSYWSGVASEGLELHDHDGRAIFAFPTNDGLFAIFVAFPAAELRAVRGDIEGSFMAAVDNAPDLAERVREGTREERFYGATNLPNFLRRPHGPGWALVGDAGCHKDPFMALGVCDALRDAELLADALHKGFSGERPLEEALAGYEQARNEQTLPLYRANLQSARLEGPPPEVRAVRAAMRSADQEDVNRLFLAVEGMIPEESFFNPENMGRIMAGARS
jgi:flavin-dependent dehydrogenase